jgi:hypothetical protein
LFSCVVRQLSLLIQTIFPYVFFVSFGEFWKENFVGM